MDKFIITKDQLIALLNYLKSRPYQEVIQGIKVLETLPMQCEVMDEAEMDK